jgi:hypothetical protein
MSFLLAHLIRSAFFIEAIIRDSLLSQFVTFPFLSLPLRLPDLKPRDK